MFSRLLVFAVLALPWIARGDEIITNEPILPDGRMANAPFKPEHRVKNWETFGLGNCVVASMCQNALYLGKPEWAKEFYRSTQGVPGGHNPDKLAAQVLEPAKRKFKDLRYLQFWGKGDAGYNMLCRISELGYPVGIVWGTGTRYNDQIIAHMVSGIHFDKRFVLIADNNFPGEYSCVPAPEARRRMRMLADEWCAFLYSAEDVGEASDPKVLVLGFYLCGSIFSVFVYLRL